MRMRVQPWVRHWLGQRVCGDKPLSLQGAAVPKIAHTLARGLARKAPQLSRGAVPELEQWTDEFLGVAPAADRSPVDLLPHLPDAGSRDGSDRLVEFQASLIPREPYKIKNPSGPCLLIRDQFRVAQLQQRIRRQHTAPVCNQAVVFAVVVSQIRQVHGEVQHRRELLEVAREARIDRVTPQADYAGVRKYRMNEAQIIGIERLLVDDPQRVPGIHLQNAQIFACHPLALRFGERPLPDGGFVFVREAPQEVQFPGSLRGWIRGDDLFYK